MNRLVLLAALLLAAPAVAQTPVVVTGGGATSAFRATSQSAKNCTGSSGTIYTGGTAANGFVRIKVPSTASAGVYFNWTGAAADTSSGEYLSPGESIVWGALANNVTCITAGGTIAVIVTQ